MLQVGRSQVRFSMKSLGFSIDLTFQPHYGSTQSLIEKSTMNLCGGKERSVRKAENFSAICEPIV
jgi:hypothetical protein